MNPFLIAGVIGTFAQMQATSALGYEEMKRQRAIASQQDENANMMRLQAIQEENARADAFNRYLKLANAKRAVNNRTTTDRSFNALMDAQSKKSAEENRRAILQSLFQQARTRFAADDALRAGQIAVQSRRTQSLGMLTSTFFQAKDLI
tara:strand:- start:1016 stop:1462 length:447 start_codon:yes stop_codon:yes gene_type:complete